jgi:hypothetical protein
MAPFLSKDRFKNWFQTAKKNKGLSIACLVLTALLAYLVYQLIAAAYDRELYRGAACAGLGLILFVVLVVRLAPSSVLPNAIQPQLRWPWKAIGQDGNLRPYPLWADTLLLCLSAAFLLAFPYSDFLRAVGLAPGLAFTLILAFLWRGLSDDKTLSTLTAIAIWCVVVWLWGEAGREGFVVLPVDVPAGAEAKGEDIAVALKAPAGTEKKEVKLNRLEFTGEGMANALETANGDFGNNEPDNYGQSEAAQILAADTIKRLFPENPWYTGPSGRSAKLTGLETSRVVSNTQIHDLPLGPIYNLLRHIRGKPMIEGQVLIGDDSLTIALRRSNYELLCLSTHLPNEVADKIAKLYSEKKEVKLDEISSLIRDDRQSYVSNVAECRSGFLRQALASLDLASEAPLGTEERIANITISNAKGDYQLAEALHFAALEAMSKLSVERLAFYYDKMERHESALDNFKQALPSLILEYKNTPTYDRRSIRDRLVEVLIRIGDLDGEKHIDNEDEQGLSKGAYCLATQVAGEGVDGGVDLRVAARIAYHYLVLAEATSIMTGNGLSVEQRTKLETDYLTLAKDAFEQGDTEKGYRSQYRRYDEYQSRDTLAWMEANYAYVLAALSQNSAERNAEEVNKLVKKSHAKLRCALIHGNPSMIGRDVICSPDMAPPQINKTDDELIDGDRDLRVAAAAAYICSRQPAAGRNADGGSCPAKPDKLRTKVETLLRTTEPYTINNSLVIEDQLRQFYCSVAREPEAKEPKADRKCESFDPDSLLHTTWMYLLEALREYRAGAFEKSLTSIDAALALTENAPTKPELTRYVQLANAFVASTYEEQPPKEKPDENKIKERAKGASENLKDILYLKESDKREEIYWRASSLNAVRQAMCLNDSPFKDCEHSFKEVFLGNTKTASDAMPEDAYLHANAGIALLRAGKDGAVGEFSKAVQINSRDPWLRCLLSYAHWSAGEIEEADTQAQLGRLLDPKGWAGYDKTLRRVWPVLASNRGAGITPPAKVDYHVARK